MKLNNLYDIISDGWRYTVLMNIKAEIDCYIENKFKWRYADEALKLIGGEEQ